MLRAVLGTPATLSSTYGTPLATPCQSIALDALIPDENDVSMNFSENQQQVNRRSPQEISLDDGKSNSAHTNQQTSGALGNDDLNYPQKMPLPDSPRQKSSSELLKDLFHCRLDIPDESGKTSLHIHAATGNSDLVNYLLKNRAIIDKQDNNGATPLHLAIKNNHTEVAKVLIKAHIEKNISLASKIGALFRLAASWGNREIMQALIETKTKAETGIEIDLPNLPDWEGRPLLHHAAICGDDNMAKILLDLGAKVDFLDANKTTPLLLAIENDSVDVAKRLFDIYKPLKSQAMELLRAVAKQGNADMFTVLKAADLDLDRQDGNGNTILHDASIRGNLKIVQTLLKWGAKVNICDIDGATPLHNATIPGYTAIVDLLLKHGADKDAQTLHGRTPASMAAEYHRFEILKALIEAGVDPHQQDKFGKTLLHIAVPKRSVKLSGQDSDAKKAAEKKAKEGCIRTVTILLQNYVGIALSALQEFFNEENLNIGDEYQDSNIRLIKEIIAKGLSDNRGRTPQEIADKWSYPEVAEMIKVALKQTKEAAEKQAEEDCITAVNAMLQKNADIASTEDKRKILQEFADKSGYAQVQKMVAETIEQAIKAEKEEEQAKKECIAIIQALQKNTDIVLTSDERESLQEMADTLNDPQVKAMIEEAIEKNIEVAKEKIKQDYITSVRALLQKDAGIALTEHKRKFLQKMADTSEYVEVKEIIEEVIAQAQKAAEEEKAKQDYITTVKALLQENAGITSTEDKRKFLRKIDDTSDYAEIKAIIKAAIAQSEKTAEAKAKEDYIATTKVMLQKNVGVALTKDDRKNLQKFADTSAYAEVKEMVEAAIAQSQGWLAYIRTWQSYVQNRFSFLKSA